MSDIVERAKAALEGVTEGPWQWERSTLTGGQGAYDEVLTPGPVDCMAYCYGGTSVIESYNPERDREFIAVARTLVPELVAEVERLRTALQSPLLDLSTGAATGSDPRLRNTATPEESL